MDRKLIRPSLLPTAAIVAAIAAAMVAGVPVPASAEVFVVTLKNGNTIESSRQPERASWDANTVLVLSEVGNWVGIAKSQIKVVEERSQIHGFGHRIDSTTIALADSINDLPEPPAGQDPNALYAAVLERMATQSAASSNYSIRQGVQTEEMGTGIPLSAIGLGTFPVGAPPPPSVPQASPGAAPTGGAGSSGGVPIQ